MDFGIFIGTRNATFDYYISGLSITYSNARKHIWSFASGNTERGSNSGNSPCARYVGTSPPPFIANNYYCEAAALYCAKCSIIYFDDILWDGAGCTGGSNCCDNTTQPWFYRQLNQTTQDDIEAQICAYQEYEYESILID